MSAILNHAIRCFGAKLGAPMVRNMSCHVTTATTVADSGGVKFWKRLSFFVALPIVALCMGHAYLKHQNSHTRKKFIKYEYLQRRTKRFPWGDGDKSLFHNKRVNALPDGYED